MEYISRMETTEITKAIPSLKKIERLSVGFYALTAIIIVLFYINYLPAFIIGAALSCFDYWLLKKSVGGIRKKKKNLFFIVSNFLRYLIFIIITAILLFAAKLNWIGFALAVAVGPIFLVLSVVICVLYEKIRTNISL